MTARLENGAEALLSVRVSGDIVGDMAPLTHSPRSASVITCGQSWVSVIKGQVFVDFVAASGPAGLAMSRFGGDRLRWANQRRLDLAGYPAEVCLARVLLALAERHGHGEGDALDIGVPLTQAELGGLIGARQATVQKALRDLHRLGLVERGKRRVMITDRPRLVTFAELG